MECFNKHSEKFYVFMRLQLGEDAKQIAADLKKVAGIKAAAYSTIQRWRQEFKTGKKGNNSDKPKQPLKRASNERNVAAVAKLVKEDPHVCIREISARLSLSYGTVHRIIHNDLHLRKLAAKWVPHKLTEEQKKQRVHAARDLLNRFEPNGPKRLTDVVTGDETWVPFFGIASKRRNKVWLGQNDQRHQICRKGFQSRKRLFTVFFNYQGSVAVDILPANTTVTGSYYAETVLPKVAQEISSQRPNSGTQNVLLLHDNASPHKTRAITRFLEENKIQVLPHPPYSPDLAPCDFWLFPLLKDRLAEKKFHRIQDLAKAVKSVLNAIPKEDYRKAFSDWLRRLQRCIDVRGEYFEGML